MMSKKEYVLQHSTQSYSGQRLNRLKNFTAVNLDTKKLEIKKNNIVSLEKTLESLNKKTFKTGSIKDEIKLREKQLEELRNEVSVLTLQNQEHESHCYKLKCLEQRKQEITKEMDGMLAVYLNYFESSTNEVQIKVHRQANKVSEQKNRNNRNLAKQISYAYKQLENAMDKVKKCCASASHDVISNNRARKQVKLQYASETISTFKRFHEHVGYAVDLLELDEHVGELVGAYFKNMLYNINDNSAGNIGMMEKEFRVTNGDFRGSVFSEIEFKQRASIVQAKIENAIHQFLPVHSAVIEHLDSATVLHQREVDELKQLEINLKNERMATIRGSIAGGNMDPPTYDESVKN